MEETVRSKGTSSWGQLVNGMLRVPGSTTLFSTVEPAEPSSRLISGAQPPEMVLLVIRVPGASVAVIPLLVWKMLLVVTVVPLTPESTWMPVPAEP